MQKSSSVNSSEQITGSQQFSSQQQGWMQRALRLAEEGRALGEVPVGAVLVQGDDIVGEGFNHPVTSRDPTAHAEIVALRSACKKLGNYRVPGTVLYVSLEPCAMCAGALVHARVGKVIYAAAEPKAGAVDSTQRFFESPQLNHKVQWQSGLMKDEAKALLQDFFKRRREQKRQLKNS